MAWRPLALISRIWRRWSALSSWFVKSAISFFNAIVSAISFFDAIVRLRATMLSSATKKEPSPHAIARPVVAEAGATKSIHQAKESRLVAKTKVPLRANAVIKTGSKRSACGRALKP